MYGIYESGAVIAKFTAPLSVTSNQPIFVSDTLSLKRQITKRAAQRWEVSTGIEPLSSTAQDLFVNLISKGYSDVVTILMPQNAGAMSLARLNGGSPVATAGAGASQVSVTGFSGIIPKGVFIKFDSHNKIYLATSTVTATSSANTYTLNIYPTLRSGVAGSSVTYRADVIMNCLYDTDVALGMTYSDGILMDLGTVKLVEKL
jgi:hypothetical protein